MFHTILSFQWNLWFLLVIPINISSIVTMWKGRCSFNHLDSILVGALTAFSHTTLNIIETSLLQTWATCPPCFVKGQTLSTWPGSPWQVSFELYRHPDFETRIYLGANKYFFLRCCRRIKSKTEGTEFLFSSFFNTSCSKNSQYFVLQKLHKFVQNCTKIDYLHILTTFFKHLLTW